MILKAKPYVEIKIKELKERVDKLDKKPELAIIQVSGDDASDVYVRNKMKRCAEVGIFPRLYKYHEYVEPDTIEDKIQELNNDPTITGILLQLPLPDHFDSNFLINQISPHKDVDGLTWYNTGKLSQGLECIPPCTPKGIIELLEFYDIPMEGRDVLIINDSNLVGKPLAQLFLQKGATVTIAHKRTEFLKDKIYESDIVVTAVGIPNFLDCLDFGFGTTIIDVGINFDEDGKMCGDVSKKSYKVLDEVCKFTPVPGGVGQTTVIALLDTLVELAEKNKEDI